MILSNSNVMCTGKPDPVERENRAGKMVRYCDVEISDGNATLRVSVPEDLYNAMQVFERYAVDVQVRVYNNQPRLTLINAMVL